MRVDDTAITQDDSGELHAHTIFEFTKAEDKPIEKVTFKPYREWVDNEDIEFQLGSPDQFYSVLEDIVEGKYKEESVYEVADRFYDDGEEKSIAEKTGNTFEFSDFENKYDRDIEFPVECRSCGENDRMEGSMVCEECKEDLHKQAIEGYPDLPTQDTPEEVINWLYRLDEEYDASEEDEALLYQLLGSGTPEWKMSKEDAEYKSSPEGNAYCGNCEYAYYSNQSGEFICSKVRGKVEWEGWCRLWDHAEPDELLESEFGVPEGVEKEWVPYTGTQGGEGWRSTVTQETRYQENRPTDSQAPDLDEVTMEDVEQSDIQQTQVWQEIDSVEDFDVGQRVSWYDPENDYTWGAFVEEIYDDEIILETESQRRLSIPVTDGEPEGTVRRQQSVHMGYGPAASNDTYIPEEKPATQPQIALEAMRSAASTEHFDDIDPLVNFYAYMDERGEDMSAVDDSIEYALMQHPYLDPEDAEEIKEEAGDLSEEEDVNELQEEQERVRATPTIAASAIVEPALQPDVLEKNPEGIPDNADYVQPEQIPDIPESAETYEGRYGGMYVVYDETEDEEGEGDQSTDTESEGIDIEPYVQDMDEGDISDKANIVVEMIEDGATRENLRDLGNEIYDDPYSSTADSVVNEIVEMQFDGVDIDGFDSSFELSSYNSDFAREYEERIQEEIGEEQYQALEEAYDYWSGYETDSDVYIDEDRELEDGGPQSDGAAPIWQLANEITGNDNLERDELLDMDVDDSTIEALMLHKESVNEALREVYGDTVTAFRGLTGDIAQELKGSGGDMDHRAVESWAVKPGIAEDFATWDGADGVMIETEIDIEDIVSTSDFGSGMEWFDDEYLVAHDDSTQIDEGAVIDATDPGDVLATAAGVYNG